MTMQKLCLYLFSALLLTACSSSAVTNYYVLTANVKPQETLKPIAVDKTLSLGIQKVEIPEYLQRSQISYLTHGNKLDFIATEKWSEPLDIAIQRILKHNLQTLDSSINIINFPWKASQKPELAISVNIMELNRLPTGDAVLKAEWILHDLANKQTVLQDRYQSTVKLADSRYLSLSKAYSDLFAKLSMDMHAKMLMHVNQD